MYAANYMHPRLCVVDNVFIHRKNTVLFYICLFILTTQGAFTGNWFIQLQLCVHVLDMPLFTRQSYE